MSCSYLSCACDMHNDGDDSSLGVHVTCTPGVNYYCFPHHPSPFSTRVGLLSASCGWCLLPCGYGQPDTTHKVYPPIADRTALWGGTRWTDDIVNRKTRIVSKHNIGTMLFPYLCKPALVASELECPTNLAAFCYYTAFDLVPSCDPWLLVLGV